MICDNDTYEIKDFKNKNTYFERAQNLPNV
jgi:hypothetical protein